MKLNKLLKRGQSLLETIFALGILLIAVTGILALAVSGATSQKESESQIIANNLAREAIEVVRNSRDSNWLSDLNWNYGFGQGQIAIVYFDRQTGSWNFDFNPQDYFLYVSYDGLYLHDSSGRKSPFSRRIIFEYICQDQDGYEAIKYPCDSDEQEIGLKLTSEVSWSEKGKDRKVTLEDLLYDWK